MRNFYRFLVLMLFMLSISIQGFSDKVQFGNFKGTENIKSTAAGCLAPSGFQFLYVNNVRARINTGGDMWWNLDNVSQYYIPANTSKTSMFSGSLWIGGLDINNQLKLAALRYRQVGQDYWTGPLTIDGTAAIDEETCAEWDKFFQIKRADVDEFIQWFNSDNKAEDFPGYVIPRSIMEYPAHGVISKGQSFYMAPFKDVDGSGDYDPNMGDYPYYDITNELCPLNYVGDPNYVPTPTLESELYEDYFGGILVDQVLKGDETLWWVFNDKGNIHTETEGSAIGMEIRAQAFGFSTNDEINNMTFYSYEIINRSTYELTQTYFSPWVDTDLGYAYNDYVGCDVQRGLGYCYNGTDVDEGGPEAYGEQPPAVGVDFFQGPYMDADTCDNPAYKGDGLLGPSINNCEIVSFDGNEVELPYGRNDSLTGVFKVQAEAINGINFGNGIQDDERYGMKRFVYHNNGGAAYMSDPGDAPEYYNFLRGIWKDNTKMYYGGNAHVTSGALGPECNFMFPGDSDPCNWGTGGLPPNGGFNTDGYYWTEEVVDNNPFDRRFMQSAGPFTLKPGAVNYITVGIPWARAIAGGPWASVELLRIVDDKCQALFDNCFKVINGPDAPDLTFQELDREVIVYITNSKNSNNYKESYKELDPQIKALTPDSLLGTDQEFDPFYTFEGYQIFELSDGSVTISDSRDDPDKVRLIAQYDVRNGVGQLVNYEFNQALGGNVPQEMAIESDNGVVHSFKITSTAFPKSNDSRLVNNKQYYFSVLAYGHNNYKEYDQTDPTKLNGQKKPYLAGRKNIKVYTTIPHKTVNGLVMNSNFGDGPQITRIEGNGNGGVALEFTDETINQLLAKSPAGPTASGDTVKYGDPDYPIAYTPTYKYGKGPVFVKVIDPLSVKEANYTLKFDTVFKRVTYHKVSMTDGMAEGGDTLSITASPGWIMIDQETGRVYNSDTSTHLEYEQLFPELGISITFGAILQAGPYTVGKMADEDNTPVNIVPAPNNGLISATIEFSDSSKLWYSGMPDQDIIGFPMNWIRSGTYDDDWASQNNPWDPNEVYEKLIGGTWAPYAMCAYNGQDSYGAAPAFGQTGGTSKSLANELKNLYSVEVVFTPDKSKWTRSPVVEMCADALLAEGGAMKYTLRRSASLDKDGNPSGWPADNSGTFNPDDPNYIAAHGMGWFPGYAVNLETGERLNIMFGEDSYLSMENGRDMLFNPTSSFFKEPLAGNNIVPLFGGKHYVYIMGSGEFIRSSGSDTLSFKFGAYDAGRTLYNALDTLPSGPFYQIYGSLIYASAQYVNIPMSVPDVEWLANEVKVRINVNRPYKRYFANKPLPKSSGNGQNNHYPMFEFTTKGIAVTTLDPDKVEKDLDLIAVVPNPYYAFAVGAGYESVPLQTLVKIVNLPEKCTVTIYNVNGTKIRQFTKDDPVTFLDWDLKNHAGIPIAGGIYLIHVKDETTGKERIVKWFGSLRIEDFKEF
ncbi:MAG: T9SS type A sorting domain-containing protein [Bacteroidales bacterium]|nr:T9SS type A sorting domain-containing protein [Bacteroidales bacterium]MCF8405415.1 T9SS type A sorting domain-containing protein [Bacteroidales bacterium]